MLGGEQGHLARYITTLGVGIIAGTLSLAAIFMRMKTELLIPAAELEQLPKSSREAVVARQADIAFVASNFRELVAIGLALGLAVFALGLVLWVPKQRRLDRHEVSDAELADLNVRARKFDLASSQLESDAMLAVGIPAPAPGQVSSPPPDQEAGEMEGSDFDPTDSDRNSRSAAIYDAMEAIFALENELEWKLNQAFGTSHLVDRGGVLKGSRRDGRVWRPDFALSPFELDGRSYAIELKYVSRGNSLGRTVSSGSEQLQHSADPSANAPFTPVLIVVVNERVPDSQFSRAQSLWENNDRQGRLRVLLLREGDFHVLEAARLRRMITGSED